MKIIYKKLLALGICLSLICACSTGCATAPGTNIKGKINIVCTVFPQYDWVINLLGDRADEYNVTLLVDNGVDIHSYQPSARDIVTIATCDLFIYVGGESDSWVDDVIAQADNPDMHVINMMDVLGDNTYAEELVEGMEDEGEGSSLSDLFSSNEHKHNHEHEHEEDCDEHEHEHVEYDEHIWLSLKNATIICSSIFDELCKLDEGFSSSYEDAFNQYTDAILALNSQYEDTVESSDNKVLLFGDRFPFRYMAEDYGLEYYAAFPGCSAETEASFETIVFLSDKMDELSLNHVCVTESSDQSLAGTIIDNADTDTADIVIFDSMQSVCITNSNQHVSYLGIMEYNLASLKKALD